MALASTDVAFGIPLSVYPLVTTIPVLRPWVSWSHVHSWWLRVVTFGDDQILPSATYTTLFYLPRWITTLMCIMAFLYFGVGDDALKEYRRWLSVLAKAIKWKAKPWVRFETDILTRQV